jgi:tRNA(fMet)-specific endonuclease VapC
MLDTNMVSHFIRQHPAVVPRVVAVPMTALCISAITEGELRFGLAKRPDAKRLQRLVDEFLKRVDVLPWERQAASHYGPLRAILSLSGVTLGSLDLLIAAHAVSTRAVLVTNDRAFTTVPGLAVEDWYEQQESP